MGTRLLCSNRVYQGVMTFSQNEPHNHMEDEEGEDVQYRGDWSNDLPHGEGVMEYSDGHVRTARKNSLY